MPKLNLRQKENLDGYLFLTPAILFFAVFMVYPFFYSFYLSLQEKTGMKLTDLSFAGLTQYQKVLADPEFISSLINTGIYTFSVVFFQVAIGLLTAVVLNRALIGKTLTRSFFFIPVIISTIVCGVIWTWMYDPAASGLMNRAISIFGIEPIAWLKDPKWAMTSVIVMSIWKWIGYHMVIYLAGLQGISNDYYEAASLEGANVLQKFIHITFPLLSNTTWLLVITSIINSFQIFDQIYTMTNGGPMGATNVIVYFIYKAGFISFDLPYASAAAWLLFVVIFILTLAQLKVQSKNEQ
ncbi:carbohydrate ABC transporter permease [Massiliimalia massiliensis]|uniref:carbohydrate ABC transporter permease n=1 Tax=Massiliimalia massiliensis TaxID=1852384 RepID=UPI000985840B|nr:sugar ABC transporter permease [Massiliimalia massiliensis]